MTEDLANIIGSVSAVAANSPIILVASAKQATVLKLRGCFLQFGARRCDTMPSTARTETASPSQPSNTKGMDTNVRRRFEIRRVFRSRGAGSRCSQKSDCGNPIREGTNVAFHTRSNVNVSQSSNVDVSQCERMGCQFERMAMSNVARQTNVMTSVRAAQFFTFLKRHDESASVFPPLLHRCLLCGGPAAVSTPAGPPI